MDSGKKYTVGIFSEEEDLFGAIKDAKAKGVNIHEVFSPYPLHGIDDLLGYKMSRLPIAAFFFGLTGTICALTLMYGTMGFDWPMIIGGKDFTALPTFIPVIFELTVLLAAHGMVITFFIASDLKPWGDPKIFDIRSTNDKLVLAVDLAHNKMGKDEINKILSANGAEEVNDKNFD